MLKREIVAVCMESPLYFTLPVAKRLELVKRHETLIEARDLREVFLGGARAAGAGAGGKVHPEPSVSGSGAL